MGNNVNPDWNSAEGRVWSRSEPFAQTHLPLYLKFYDMHLFSNVLTQNVQDIKLKAKYNYTGFFHYHSTFDSARCSYT